MFDKLEEIVRRQQEIVNELNEPTVVNDQNRFRKLMKEQTDLAPLVEKYLEYKEAKAGIEDSLAMLEEESDEDLKVGISLKFVCKILADGLDLRR